LLRILKPILAIKASQTLKMDLPVGKGEDGKLLREGIRININKMYQYGPPTHIACGVTSMRI